MRDITKEILQQSAQDEHLEDEESRPFVEYMGLRFPIPTRFIHVMQRMQRFFEVDGVDDIVRNYRTLTKPSRLPLLFHLWRWLCVKPKAEKNDEYYPSEEEYARDFLTHYHYRRPQWNQNCAIMHNARITNFLFYYYFRFSACYFTATDSAGSRIPAIFEYSHNPPEKNDYEAQEQLSRVLAAPATTEFELYFSVVNESYFDPKYRWQTDRGKKLLVHAIIGSDRSRDSTDVPIEVDSLPVNTLDTVLV